MSRFLLYRRRHGQRGMVLVEVIAALTIFALVAFSLVKTLDAALDAAKSRLEIDAAMRGLENQMALLHSGPISATDRDLPDDGSGLTYHVTIQPAQFQDQKKQIVASMFRVTITVKWTTDEGPDDRSVSELIYQP
ncbi:MAG: type II secretion system GspH family protein [Methylacidiphilales bacterium]|nr:type II secretion system GspH family protein [Candidatus Methylacidiphilales bacterium]